MKCTLEIESKSPLSFGESLFRFIGRVGGEVNTGKVFIVLTGQ